MSAAGPEVQVWWASLTDADHRLLGMLSSLERHRVSDLDLPADRGRSLVGAALLRSVVAANLNCDPSQVRVDRTCTECGGHHGRPRVQGPQPAGRHTPPRVSLSHSGHLIVVALCETTDVGVDVQRSADLAAGQDAWTWAVAESLVKAGAPPQHTTCPIQPPRAGYVGALTVAGAKPPSLSTHVWHPTFATSPPND